MDRRRARAGRRASPWRRRARTARRARRGARPSRPGGLRYFDDARDAGRRAGQERTRRAGRARSARPSCSNTTAASAHANPSARSENTPAPASSSNIARSKPAAHAFACRSGPRAAPRCRRAARPGRRRDRGPSLAHRGSRGQAEHTLADDVALDLRRAGRDRERERPQALLDELVVVDVQRVAVEHAQAQLAEPLARFGVRELHHHRAGTGRRRAPTATRCASSAPTARRTRRAQWPSSRRVRRVVRRAARDPRTSRSESTSSLDERGAALVLQRDVGDAPAVVLGADAVRDRHPHVGEEHLGELRRAEHRLAAAASRCRAGPSAGSATRCRGASARRDRCARGTRRRRRPARTSTRSSGRSARSRRRRASARVRSDARSEPAPGSEKPWHHTSSPRRICGRCAAFCSSVPSSISVGPACSVPTKFTPTYGALARVVSS